VTFDDLAKRTASWLDGSGDLSALVVSSRVRLARNLPFSRFVHLSSEEERSRIIEAVVAASGKDLQDQRLSYFDANDLNPSQRALLVERHLISPALEKGDGPRGVLVNEQEDLSVMVNEEDHLRIQVMQSGFQVDEAWSVARRSEHLLAEDLAFAFSEKWGYLTACPSNTGTGMRASILIHLPGLVLTQEMEGVIRGVTQMGFAVRGLYGEGSDVSGNLFQVSNQVTLGRSEMEILESLDKVTRQLVQCEQNARDTLLGDIRSKIEDKVWRAFGILSHARLLSSQEFMNLSSAVRLGIGLELFKGIEVGTLNELMVQTKPFHLQNQVGRQLDSPERDRVRADMARRRMAELGNP
jgi:protein arginine kinase